MKSAVPKVVVSIIGLVFLSQCAAPQRQPTVAPYTPRFGYATSGGGEKATGISISLVTPSWTVMQRQQVFSVPGMPVLPIPPNTRYSNPLNDLFAKSLATDLEKLLTDRGFTFSGPFASLDEMTFPQKKQTDLVLTPEIAVELNQPQIAHERVGEVSFMAGGAVAVDYYSANGVCTATGFVAFKVIEPLSGQKLWLKKVDVPQVMENCIADKTKDPNQVQVLVNNGTARVLEKIYGEVMKKADSYFSREEMELVKKQSLELREKKVY